MNEKNKQKKEVPKKVIKTKQQKKQNSWFIRNKEISAVTIGTLIIIIVIAGTWCYISSRISSMTATLKSSEQRIENLEQKIDIIGENQKKILTSVNEINNRLNKSLAPQISVEPSTKSEHEIKISKPGAEQSKEDNIKDSHIISWNLVILLILIIIIISLGYIVIKIFRKKEYIGIF